MKILNTKELNEKLNIQPVTKQQLSNHGREMWVNTNNWKDRLKTGDILFIRMIRRDDDGIVQHESLMCFRYVTFEDYFKYGYSFESNFENHIRSKKESKYGMLITYDRNKKTFRCIFLSTFYRDSSMTTNLVGNETTVTEIKRPVGTIEQPIKSEFFIRDNIKNTDTVCIYKDKSLNEKLNIQPVTKERLGQTANDLYKPSKDYKFKLRTGDIAIIGKPSKEPRPAVYVSHNDLENEKYESIFKFTVLTNKVANWQDGVFVFYRNENRDEYFTRKMLKDFDENFTDKIVASYIKEIYRVKHLKYPLTRDYFVNPPIEEAEIVWKIG